MTSQNEKTVINSVMQTTKNDRLSPQLFLLGSRRIMSSEGVKHSPSSKNQKSVLNRRTQKEPLAGHEVVLGAKWPAHGKSPEATGHAYYGRMLVVLWQPFKKFMCLYAFRKRVLIGHTPISSVSRGRWITKWRVFSDLGIEARRAPRQCGVCWRFSVWLLCLC